MLLVNKNKNLSGSYAIIANNINGMYICNSISGKILSINSNLIALSSNITDSFSVNNTQFLYQNNLNKVNNVIGFNSFNNFPNTDCKGGGNYYIYKNLYKIKYSDTTPFMYSNILLANSNLLQYNFIWSDIISYSTIFCTTGSNGNISSYFLSSLNFLQANNNTLIIDETSYDVNLKNIQSFYGTIIIKDYSSNNINNNNNLYKLNLNNVNNIKITYYTSNIKFYSISGSLLSFNILPAISNINKDLSAAINHSNIIYSKECNLSSNYLSLDNSFNNNIFIIKNNDLSYTHSYDSTEYNYNNYIDKNSSSVINNCSSGYYYNNIFLSSTIKYYNNNYYLNNNAYYTLDSHAHILTHKKNINIIDETNTNEFFPIQTADNIITYNKTTNDNYKNNIKNKTTYLPLNKTINTTYIPQNCILPIGSIVWWPQVKSANGSWKPEVPYGFYALTSEEQKTFVLVDCDNPKSIKYNAELANLCNASTIIQLPKGKIKTFDKVSSRIIRIIKYSDNWKYQE